MDDRTRETLFDLICSYRRRTAMAAERLRGGVGLQNLRTWRDAGIPQTGKAGDVRYYFHGIGAAVHLPDGAIDFDFGHDGRTDGFNAWQLAAFAEHVGTSERELTKWQSVDTLLQEGVREGWLHQPFIEAHDDLYYVVEPIPALLFPHRLLRSVSSSSKGEMRMPSP